MPEKLTIKTDRAATHSIGIQKSYIFVAAVLQGHIGPHM
jgi:hypothetical protein